MKRIIILGSLIFSMSAQAWQGTTLISGINVYNDGHVVVKFSGFQQNTYCGSPYFSLGVVGSPQQRAMHANALIAMATGKSVTVASTPGDCNGGEEKLTYLQINAS